MKKKLSITKEGFFINGEKYELYSGAVHYFRVHPDYWRDRLLKLRACGLNTVETYIAWNVQEPMPGEFAFEGFADFERFLDTAAELGLYAIVRPGPFICAEWEMGGLPAWLSEIEGIQLRRFNRPYLDRVDRYFDAIMPRIVPRLSTNGGNIIAVQVENEFGGFGIEDREYLEYLKNGLISRGIDVPLFTCDGVHNGDLERGCLDGVFMTANFGSRYELAFERLKSLQPELPPVCMELWNTWFDQWGAPRHKRDPKSVLHEVGGIIDAGGGFNLYMFHGGTNFGFMNGSNCNPVFEPTVTSYDYGAPLNEYGAYTDTYTGIRELIAEKTGVRPPELPPEPVLKSYGSIGFTASAPLFDVLSAVSDEYRDDKPHNMEHYGQMYGYILYTVNTERFSGRLDIGEPRDRVMVFADGKLLGVIERDGRRDDITVTDEKELRIFVENMGHVNFGQRIYDKKGILEYIKIGGKEISGVTVNCIPMTFKTLGISGFASSAAPMLYKGSFTVSKKADTFLFPESFTRGSVLLNGFNLGRYNAAGPQRTLYVPAPLLREGENEVIILDLEPASEPSASLLDRHILE